MKARDIPFTDVYEDNGTLMMHPLEQKDYCNDSMQGALSHMNYTARYEEQRKKQEQLKMAEKELSIRQEVWVKKMANDGDFMEALLKENKLYYYTVRKVHKEGKYVTGRTGTVLTNSCKHYLTYLKG